MERYLNLSGNSGVSGYEIGDVYIRVKFHTDEVYRYSYARAGRQHVENMKVLAVGGRGLSTYINKHVHDLYDREE
jgi:hypothetical protein